MSSCGLTSCWTFSNTHWLGDEIVTYPPLWPVVYTCQPTCVYNSEHDWGAEKITISYNQSALTIRSSVSDIYQLNNVTSLHPVGQHDSDSGHRAVLWSWHCRGAGFSVMCGYGPENWVWRLPPGYTSGGLKTHQQYQLWRSVI